MDIKNLPPRVFSANPENVDSRKEWLHWQKKFTTYTANMTEVSDTEKLNLLINHVDASVHKLISEVTTYNDAIRVLESTYVKRTNPIFARYELISCKQQSGESLDRYLQKLKQLSMYCDYQAVSVQLHKEEAIRDAFIGGFFRMKSDSACSKTATSLSKSRLKKLVLSQPLKEMLKAIDLHLLLQNTSRKCNLVQKIKN